MKAKRKQKYHNPPSPMKYMMIASLINIILFFAIILFVNTIFEPLSPSSILVTLMNAVIWASVPSLLTGLVIARLIDWRIDATMPVDYIQAYVLPVYIFILIMSVGFMIFAVWSGLYLLAVFPMGIYAVPFAVMTHFYLHRLWRWQLQQDSKMKSGQPAIKLQSLDPVEHYDEA